MVDRPLAVGGRYTVKHLTRSVPATCARIRHRFDVNTHHRIEGVATLGLNDLGVVELQLGEPLFVDAYRANRATGSFILIDDDTNDTVGAGMIEAAA
jgi:bifunctional enzyme CysN/CysC